MQLKDLAGAKMLEIVPKTDIRHPIDPDASGAMFTLDGKTYLVFEDPSDGYRSNAGPLLCFEGPAYEIGGEGWSPTYIREQVTCRHVTVGGYGGDDDILEIVSDETGSVIFRIGTADVDDYYPGYICEWSPSGLSANSKTRAHN